MNSKFLQISEDLIKNSQDNGEMSFIFKTKIHAILVFNIFGNKKITFEDLCKNLDSVASRTTIQSILIDGVDKDYLSKEVDQKDKRKKYYNCNNLREVITKWFQRNKLIFTS
ncbi:hypothetical protein IDH35_05315 [Pelagibacterales bacterium SAG-MED49]|nr:hypothetical protein [Pelagibacterales bacterium SAG-MED49]